MTSFVALRKPSEGKPPEVEKQQLISLSRQRCSTPVGFGQGFLSKEHCENIHLALAWLQLIFTCSLD
jgi:hypothetical protein